MSQQLHGRYGRRISTRACPPGLMPSLTIASPTGTASSHALSWSFCLAEYGHLLHRACEIGDLVRAAHKLLDPVLGAERDRQSLVGLVS